MKKKQSKKKKPAVVPANMCDEPDGNISTSESASESDEEDPNVALVSLLRGLIEMIRGRPPEQRTETPARDEGDEDEG